jgi:hypothetical protein
MRSALRALTALLALSTPCIAGIADSPLPVLLAGSPTLHLYSVPGVMCQAGLATFFSCTSTEGAATIQVGVEMFGSAGVHPSAMP